MNQREYTRFEHFSTYVRTAYQVCLLVVFIVTPIVIFNRKDVSNEQLKNMVTTNTSNIKEIRDHQDKEIAQLNQNLYKLSLRFASLAANHRYSKYAAEGQR